MSSGGAANGDKPDAAKTDAVFDKAKMKEKLNVFKDKMAANAAVLNEQMAKNAANLRERMGAQDSDDDDDESSDEEVEELLFGDSATTGATTTTAATAVTVRSQMPPSFISLEEEETIKTQLKAAKTLRKRLRKLKKLTSSSLKHTQEATNRIEKLLLGVNAATEGPCTDPGIQKLASTSAENAKTLRESGDYERYKANVTEQVVEQMKPLMDHAKYLSVVGKERRQARDKRIELERGELDVADEAAYMRSVDIVKAFDDKTAAYKDEFSSLVEHNSSQIGQTLKTLLLESATYYEKLAQVLRASANSVAANPNHYMTDAAAAKFKNYEAPAVESAFTAPGLFSVGNGNRSSAAAAPAGGSGSAVTEDRLTAKPTARLRDDVVTGIPLTDSADNRPQQGDAYGTSSYSRSTPVSAVDTNARVMRTIENFLNTGAILQSTAAASRQEKKEAPAEPQPNTADSMQDIRYLEENFGIAWPRSPTEADDPDAEVESTRSLTPTDGSILPTIARRQPHYYGSGMS